MNESVAAMPAPISVPSDAAPRVSKRWDVLSPSSVALIQATEQLAAKPGQVTTGSLRVRVLQVTDLPGPSAPLGSSLSWLRNPVRRPSPSKLKTESSSRGSVCVLLRTTASERTLVTDSVPRAASALWNEEFFFETVSTDDELRFVCVDRAKNDPHHHLPMREDAESWPGFIGKVSVPLVRLPEGEGVEQWYPLVANGSQQLRTALRISICFSPAGVRARPRIDSNLSDVRSRRPTPLITAEGSSLTMDSSGASIRIPPPSPLATPQCVALPMGIVDYVIVVGAPSDCDPSTSESTLLFRYPSSDRPQFALPTKIEWFCFPGAWLRSSKDRTKMRVVERYLVDLCHAVPTPVRGVLGVRFSMETLPITLVLPAISTIYSAEIKQIGLVARKSHRDSLGDKFSPTKSSLANLSSIQEGFQPLVYPLSAVFKYFGVKTVIELVSFVLCEYRILIHSSQTSVLCPIAEGLCALIYPFRWQHPYIPILPRVLSEYLQAPLPYILGVHSSWLPGLLENGRPDHLVIVDVDRGVIQHHESGPMLPYQLTRGLYTRINRVIGKEHSSDVEARQSALLEWDDQIEKVVRTEFVCYLSAMLMGYRDCLFFVNQRLPVFNKRRFFSAYVTNNEAMPFIARLFCTQAFQSFLENHSSPELSVFHSVYLTFTRAKDLEGPRSALCALPQQVVSSPSGGDKTEDPKASDPPTQQTPVYVLEQEGKDVCQDIGSMSNNADDKPGDDQRLVYIGRCIEELLDQDAGQVLTSLDFDHVAMDARFAEVMNQTIDYRAVADRMGVDAKKLEEHAHLFKRPHAHDTHSTAMNGQHLTAPARSLSSEEERIEQVVFKCLTSIFTSDDSLTSEEVRTCEGRFKTQYARELFVLILQQPGQQYMEPNGASISHTSVSSWYSTKGSGSCIGEAGFQLLARLSSTLMDQCAIYEDFTNARGMLQVASYYYHNVEDKKSGIGFEKKEYLITILRVRPICRSLDMWQHACSREIDAALAADPSIAGSGYPATVPDEAIFSVVGSIIYDMLTVEVPVAKVHTFVSVMCANYQKDNELLATLRQLVENVYRAVEMSKDSKSSPMKVSAGISPLQANGSVFAKSRKEPPPARSQYDLDAMIRRKMSVYDTNAGRMPTPSDVTRESTEKEDGSSMATPVPRRRGQSAPQAATSVAIGSHAAPVLSLSMCQARVVCGLSDASISVIDVNNPGKRVKLEGHSDAVVAVQTLGNTLVSGSRDHTLRAWDLKATVKKRHLFGFFSHNESQPLTRGGDNGLDLDGNAVSRKSLVLKGHTDVVTCLEISRQLSTDRAIVASGSMDGTIRIWDTSKEHNVAVLGNGKGGLRCLRYLAHFDYLVSGCHEYSLKAWDLGVSKLRIDIPAHRGCIRDIQVTGDRLVTAANDRIAKVWDARFRDGHNYSHALRDHGGPVLCITLGGPADPNVCTGSSDGLVRVWDLRYVQKGPRLALEGHLGPVTCLQRDFTSLVSGGEDGVVRVWDMHSGVCQSELRAHLSGVTCMTLQDASVFSGGYDGALRVSDVEATSLRTS
ncbi:hypothetical protein Poli38472_012840 [Pythium oligandrum]|uniref:C2 domain-containing protein n=1 Tax=Pythium oligandrum TaxID=41045 RepID=A0A8K1CJS2_PYTOL|nr:hypothetical protein Poli38472_012840 [Pythium oligandrum]|eukprot:TMW64218.1 hypothetical protein Poli38472_012840 [Pythium oligandrum]